MPQGDNEHLTPGEIAAYLAGSVAEESRTRMERHFTVCDPCRRELIGASSTATSQRRRQWAWAVLPVAAAAVVATLLLLPPSQPSTPGGPGPVLRSGWEEGVPTFAAVEPGAGATVSPSGILFRWRSAGTDPHYQFTLTDEEGDVVWSAATSDTVLILPDSVRLARGDTHYWYVDALLRGAQTATTGIQEFVIQR